MKKLIKNTFILIIILLTYSIIDTNHLVISNYEYANSSLPKEFDGFKILQISDFHNKEFPQFPFVTPVLEDKTDAKYNLDMLNKIDTISPDIIVITGDLIDSRHFKEEVATDLIKELVKDYPVYYVTGNHEVYRGISDEIKETMEELGVTSLKNQTVAVVKNGSQINLCGINDFTEFGNTTEYIDNLSALRGEGFNILLSHRPELMNIYADIQFDLVFSGHAHGGQIKIPFIGGLIAPNQGFLPEYTQGMYTEDITTLVVSRGIGNSLFPLRFLNPPELVVVTLNSK